MRELNKALAELLGIEVIEQMGYYMYRNADGRLEHIPDCAGDGNGMLWLDGKMRERGYCVNVEYLPPVYCAEYWKLDTDGDGMELVAAEHHEKETVARALAKAEGKEAN